MPVDCLPTRATTNLNECLALVVVDFAVLSHVQFFEDFSKTPKKKSQQWGILVWEFYSFPPSRLHSFSLSISEDIFVSLCLTVASKVNNSSKTRLWQTIIATMKSSSWEHKQKSNNSTKVSAFHAWNFNTFKRRRVENNDNKKCNDKVKCSNASYHNDHFIIFFDTW